MTDTATLEATIDTYLEAYLEPDGDRRDPLIEQVWAPDGHLFDPPLDAAGHSASTRCSRPCKACSPGTRSAARPGSTRHHGIARYGWELVDGRRNRRPVGDGRRRRRAGRAADTRRRFFGDLPARES